MNLNLLDLEAKVAIEMIKIYKLKFPMKFNKINEKIFPLNEAKARLEFE